ncbi:twin-arginine translocase subunit TatC [Thermodesulfobacterium sp. TA1]|uniref:twin-arginine translocase subunit TatC n=1 Tax=Thermodesulfobacterium sp. TA1 TaxID=2234087 RepID=UPI001232B96E|nr:twin-arginine translocase subunit TatC [Thermodesulfobacterium sp. TA1]QER41427.1 twin-arginine translocase subunit TatC [Thermodesulfobacterium sp. TA1]
MEYQLKETEEKKLGLIEHLLELRSCIIKAFIGWAIASVIAYLLADYIINFLLSPLLKAIPQQTSVFFRTFPEVFTSYLKLSMIFGFILGSPYIFYQIWSFIAPGLYPHEQKWVKTAVFLTSFAFILGDLLAYFLFLPFILKFLYSFGEKFLVFKPFLKDYINFCLRFFLIIGAVFQIPSFMVLLSRLGIVDYKGFKRFRPYAILIAFFLSAILTGGGDPFNQIILALPLTLLYEIGIILVRMFKPLR